MLRSRCLTYEQRRAVSRVIGGSSYPILMIRDDFDFRDITISIHKGSSPNPVRFCPAAKLSHAVVGC